MVLLTAAGGDKRARGAAQLWANPQKKPRRVRERRTARDVPSQTAYRMSVPIGEMLTQMRFR